MLDKYGLLFARAVLALEEAKMLCIPLLVRDGERQLSDGEIGRLVVNGCHLMRHACILSDMDGLLPELDRLARAASSESGMPFPPREALAQSIVHLLSRVQDELDQEFFFHVSQADVRHYGQKQPFGEKVQRKFKAASADLASAGTCLALQQPTACVFHLMRAMEVAVRDLGKRLQVTITPQTTWRQMTGQMDPKIRKMPEASERQKERKSRWEAASANLHHVGSVWRNRTMHPATSYTRSQAHDIHNAVRVFMTDLAEL